MIGQIKLASKLTLTVFLTLVIMLTLALTNFGQASAHEGAYQGYQPENSIRSVNLVSWPWGHSCNFQYAFGEAYATGYSKIKKGYTNAGCDIYVRFHYEGAGWASPCATAYYIAGCQYIGGGWLQSQQTYQNHARTAILAAIGPYPYTQYHDLDLYANGPSYGATGAFAYATYCGSLYDNSHEGCGGF
jgi:hypothetical protein